RKSTLLAHEFLKRKLEGLDSFTFTAAEAAWSEYFANRYSTTTASSPDSYPKYLAEVVPDSIAAVKAAIVAYRTHANLDEVIAVACQKALFIFQCFGYAAGRLVANASSLDEVAPESVIALKNAGLEEVW